MSDNDKPNLWGTEDGGVLHGDPDEAVESELDGRVPPLPPFLTVHGWAPVGLAMKHGDILELMMEDLAGEHEWDEGDPIEPSRRMVDAEKKLVDAFLADYHPTLCRIVPGHDVEVNVADWIRENAPSWLKENPDLLMITAESARGISVDHIGLSKEVRDALHRLRVYDVGYVLDSYGHLGWEPLESLDFPGIGNAYFRELNEALERIGVHANSDRAGVP